MQEKLDEGESALKRALEIDPGYALARQNLALLQQARATGNLPEGFTIPSPFDQQKPKSSVRYRAE
jgi:hypothetical protein